jgi:hypothetical protein
LKCKNKKHLVDVCIAIFVFMLTGCATYTKSLKFSQSEVKLIPTVAFQRVLSTTSENEKVKVWAKGVSGPAEVKGFEGQENVIVKDERNNKEMNLPINDILEIEHIWRFKKQNTSGYKHKGDSVGAVAETLFYVPIAPVAVGMWPLMRALGLDAVKNDKDESKARLVYDGMSKEDLMVYIGEPKEKYFCNDKYNKYIGDYEVWIYGKDQVLRGGRELYINLDDNTVFYNNVRIPLEDMGDKKRNNCSLIVE